MEALEFEAKAGIEEILASVKKLPADTKSTHLLTILERLRADGYPQVMVFTQFTDTLDFLRDHVAVGRTLHLGGDGVALHASVARCGAAAA